jgi:mRNA interferase MazF
VSARIRPGSVVWVSLDPTVGRKQAGTRPAVVVASPGYLRVVQELAIVLPATTTDRGWPHHVELSGPELSLPHTTYAMTEQPRTVSRRRFTDSAGHVDEACLVTLRRWLDDFLYQPGAMVERMTD